MTPSNSGSTAHLCGTSPSATPAPTNAWGCIWPAWRWIRSSGRNCCPASSAVELAGAPRRTVTTSWAARKTLAFVRVEMTLRVSSGFGGVASGLASVPPRAWTAFMAAWHSGATLSKFLIRQARTPARSRAFTSTGQSDSAEDLQAWRGAGGAAVCAAAAPATRKTMMAERARASGERMLRAHMKQRFTGLYRRRTTKPQPDPFRRAPPSLDFGAVGALVRHVGQGNSCLPKPQPPVRAVAWSTSAAVARCIRFLPGRPAVRSLWWCWKPARSGSRPTGRRCRRSWRAGGFDPWPMIAPGWDSPVPDPSRVTAGRSSRISSGCWRTWASRDPSRSLRPPSMAGLHVRLFAARNARPAGVRWRWCWSTPPRPRRWIRK